LQLPHAVLQQTGRTLAKQLMVHQALVQVLALRSFYSCFIEGLMLKTILISNLE
jgi:hypothetical protein